MMIHLHRQEEGHATMGMMIGIDRIAGKVEAGRLMLVRRCTIDDEVGVPEIGAEIEVGCEIGEEGMMAGGMTGIIADRVRGVRKERKPVVTCRDNPKHTCGEFDKSYSNNLIWKYCSSTMSFG